MYMYILRINIHLIYQCKSYYRLLHLNVLYNIIHSFKYIKDYTFKYLNVLLNVL